MADALLTDAERNLLERKLTKKNTEPSEAYFAGARARIKRKLRLLVQDLKLVEATKYANFDNELYWIRQQLVEGAPSREPLGFEIPEIDEETLREFEEMDDP